MNIKRDLWIAVLGGFLFALVSPVALPLIHDFQVNHLGVQNPSLGITTEYEENVTNAESRGLGNSTYDRYKITIKNQRNKVLRYITVAFLFPGGIESARVGSERPKANSYSRYARLAVKDTPENLTSVSNAVRIRELPPGKEVTVTFVIDTKPQEVWAWPYGDWAGVENYNASDGTLMISGQYNWMFKGSMYTEEIEYTKVNARKDNTLERFDICIGESPAIECRK